MKSSTKNSKIVTLLQTAPSSSVWNLVTLYRGWFSSEYPKSGGRQFKTCYKVLFLLEDAGWSDELWGLLIISLIFWFEKKKKEILITLKLQNCDCEASVKTSSSFRNGRATAVTRLGKSFFFIFKNLLIPNISKLIMSS